ncbi:hypothetical protein [Hornefia porci]|uniref:hypothetical protein n=1 Tax=Hornefia porci TaxID=2652292 RepID=UPI00117B1C35
MKKKIAEGTFRQDLFYRAERHSGQHPAAPGADQRHRCADRPLHRRVRGEAPSPADSV